MLTQEQIEVTNFNFFRRSEESITNPIDGRTDYLGLGYINEFRNNGLIPLLLEYYDDGRMQITSYYNNPFFYRQQYFMGTVLTPEELTSAITYTGFKILQDPNSTEVNNLLKII